MVTDKRKATFKVFFSRRMLVALIMGFASGLPLLLTITVLQAWMKEEGVDLTVIGLMVLVGIPYSVKFIWAPFLDRFTIPLLGRRRGWMLIAQVCLIASILLLGFSAPKEHPWLLACAALMVTFFSASQDIVIDAYRREDLSDEELGLGSSLYVNGYRVGMLLASGGGLIMADHMPYSMVYLIMACCLVPAVLTTALTPEPVVEKVPQNMKEAVIDPLKEYFSRDGSILILAFILLYKIGDTMASTMTTPFYLDIGFSKTEIGAIVKLFGFWAVILGTLSGGVMMLRMGINRALWIFGILQGVSTAGFAFLAYIGYNIAALSTVIAFENLSGGMGTAAYMAYMASITNKKFTATQYALLTSLMALPRTVLSSPTGFIAKHLGWIWFFSACAFIAIPGLLLLLKCAPWSLDRKEQKR